MVLLDCQDDPGNADVAHDARAVIKLVAAAFLLWLFGAGTAWWVALTIAAVGDICVALSDAERSRRPYP